MSLRLYDTATGQIRGFESVEPGRVGMYLCGLTVQGSPHIGHVRFAVAFDILRRWLINGHGYDVNLVRNVTDIDDKILEKSAAHNIPWYAWGYLHERQTTAALDALGVLPPTYEPRATGHIPEMIALMQTLVEAGHAYPSVDASGDVYFDVKSWPAYGELTHQKLDDMKDAEDSDPRGKRDPRDFALWKGVKPGEPDSASWDSPFGRGRPGWHLECSAMIRKYLGDTFDIHAGGVDLRFPHHENEQAQSKAAGLGFARFWLHNGWVTVGGEKMSKSLGNSLIVDNMLQTVRPLVLRYYLGSAHYRSPIEYRPESLADAEMAVQRIESFVARVGAGASAGSIPPEFAAALDEDLNVSAALAVIHNTVRAGNAALDAGDAATARALRESVLAMTDVLGINPLSNIWGNSPPGGAADWAMTALTALVEAELAAREQARADRDFAAADAIRARLTASGLTLEDTPTGTRWALSRPTATE